MKDTFAVFAGMITALVLVFVPLLLLRQCSGSTAVKEKTTTDTVTIVRIDTVVIEKPKPVRVVEKEPVFIRVPVPGDTTLKPGDTMQVPVPMMQYHFQKDSLYSLDVTGFNVSVDKMEVYPGTVYKTINTTTVRTEKDNRRWGIGIQAGYGYNFGTGKLAPYIGVGVQYSLWRW